MSAGVHPTMARPGDAARARLRTVRATLRAIIVVRAALWGAAAAAAVAAVRALSGGSGRATGAWDAAIVAAAVTGALA
ncbi:MAG: hypothetical protein JO180_00045, partial [Gemmatirosa sp.]|nr:hypothetical protein [Gemmatirosa sp.]